ncbi:MAG: aminotransferase class V-fold PLP-dependent enzyme [Bacteroidetes bacterium]|nr:MAG: aminotransferase class V-fold PLP-dependent enzyme [Bacteroidota bacterium]
MSVSAKLLEKIRQLEDQSRQLEPAAATRQSWQQQVLAYSEHFIRNRDHWPAYRQTADNGRGLYDSPIEEEAMDMAEALALLGRHLEEPGIETTSSRHFGYIPGGGLYPSALADYLAAVNNKYAGVFFANPGLVRMENMLIRWICRLMGYPSTAFGNLSSGGSMANLIAIHTARHARGLRAGDYHRAVVYLTAQTHHSFAKSLKVAGMEEARLRMLPLDAHYRMQPGSLPTLVQQDLQAGLIPFMVVASAGTTDTGAIDPLHAIGSLARQLGLWYHVDAAYGGFYILCEEVRPRLKGLEMSDSLIIDPHKGLFLPYGSGAVIVREARHLLAAHSYQAPYMQDAAQQEEPEPAATSVELTKHFRGLRMWLPLKLFGLRAFRAALAEKVWLARYFYERLQDLPGFETGPYPDISVVLFRYIPKNEHPNRFNQRLVQSLLQDGQVFLSTTRISGVYYLRLAVCVYRTHLADIDLCIEVLLKHIEKCKNMPQKMP